MVFSYEASKIIVPALKKYLRKKFPYLPDTSVAEADRISYSTKYKKIYRISSVVILTWLFVTPAIWGWVIYQVYSHIYSWLMHGGEMFFPGPWILFILPGVFLTALSAAQCMEWAQRLLCGKEYDTFIDYHNIKEQYDTKKANRFFKNIFIYPFIFCLLPAITTSLITTPKQLSYTTIIDYRSHTYPYSEIKRLICYLNYIDKQGNKTYSPHYKISFTDNTELTSDSYFDEAGPADVFIKILQANGIRIDTVEVDK